jgi:transglutaminase-like putative cysteine protease
LIGQGLISMRSIQPRRLAIVFACALAGLFFGGAAGYAQGISIVQIQAEIERHIADSSARTGGFYRFSENGKNYNFKLVRVHTEYLSRLGPRRCFACVDLVDEKGDVYDVDFFLQGDPGSMVVTESTLHKLNGIPSYTWQQTPDNSWKRVPVEGAPSHLLGVIHGRDQFEFRYRVELPKIEKTARLWMPLPQSDDYQTVERAGLWSNSHPRVLEDSNYANQAYFFELGPADSGAWIEVRWKVRRVEKSAYAAPAAGLEKYLKPENLVPNSEEFLSIARQVTQGKTGDMVRARAIYDHTIDRMRYMKYGTGWGKGDAVYACNARTGNCSDYHAYFIGVARAAGIPARFAVGAAIPSERDEGGIDGYHCWAEFYAEGKWWPVDVSEADKYSSLATYYFGHHPANRIELSRGRDLVFDPGPKAGTVNLLAYPVFETEDGSQQKLKVEFSFQRLL